MPLKSTLEVEHSFFSSTAKSSRQSKKGTF